MFPSDGRDTMKGRTSQTYANKCERMEKWYKKRQKLLSKEREVNSHTKQLPKRKELKPLDYYIDKIKKPNYDRK